MIATDGHTHTDIVNGELYIERYTKEQKKTKWTKGGKTEASQNREAPGQRIKYQNKQDYKYNKNISSDSIGT